MRDLIQRESASDRGRESVRSPPTGQQPVNILILWFCRRDRSEKAVETAALYSQRHMINCVGECRNHGKSECFDTEIVRGLPCFLLSLQHNISTRKSGKTGVFQRFQIGPGTGGGTAIPLEYAKDTERIPTSVRS